MCSEYLPPRNASTERKELSFQEFKKALKMLKETSPLVATNLAVMPLLTSPTLQSIFKKSLEENVFLDKLNIAKVIPVFKKGDKENVEN